MDKKLGSFKIVKSESSEKAEGAVFIEGWANRATVDRVGDLIPRAAWDLTNYKKVPIVLYNHERDQPVGRAILIEARDQGLWIKAKISDSDDEEVSKVRDLVKEGVLNAFSVGIDSCETERKDDVNLFKKCELLEVSIVTVPMNQDSTFNYTRKNGKNLIKKGFKMLKNEDLVGLKVRAESKEAAGKMAEEAGMELISVEQVDEEEESEDGLKYFYLKFKEVAEDTELEMMDHELGVAYILPSESAEKSAEAKEMVDDNPYLAEARNMNVLLSVLIEEVKIISKTLENMQPVPVVADSEEPAESDSLIEDMKEVLAGYLEDINNKLSRI